VGAPDPGSEISQIQIATSQPAVNAADLPENRYKRNATEAPVDLPALVAHGGDWCCEG